MKKMLFVLSLLLVSKAQAQNLDIYGNQGVVVPGTVTTSSISVAASQVITASATASAGLYNYITNIHIEAMSTGTVVGNAGLINNCTSQNIPSSPQWLFPTGYSIGTGAITDLQFANPVKSSVAGQADLITCPKMAGVVWNIIISAYSDF